MGVRFLIRLGISNSCVWGLVLLRLGLDFLRLRVNNSYVWLLVFLFFRVSNSYVWGF